MCWMMQLCTSKQKLGGGGGGGGGGTPCCSPIKRLQHSFLSRAGYRIDEKQVSRILIYIHEVLQF